MYDRGDLVGAARVEATACDRDGYDLTARMLRELADHADDARSVAMVPRDQLQACEAANRMLRDELARVEAERDALLSALTALYEKSDYSGVEAALAPFRKDGPTTSVSPAVAGSSQPAPEGTT